MMFEDARWSGELRPHQAKALDRLAEGWAGGRRRAWVVLPPGTGKTLVGLEPPPLYEPRRKPGAGTWAAAALSLVALVVAAAVRPVPSVPVVLALGALLTLAW